MYNFNYIIGQLYIGVVRLDAEQGKLFTVGEFAKKAGVTQRTIRFYDRIGLLKPYAHSSSGHRLYSMQDFARLQKIMTLKFIGLSLEDILNIMKQDINENDFIKSLEIQRHIIESKIQHMNMVTNAIDETLHMLDNENSLNWDKFVNIIKVINIDKNWLEQYENASNLRSRIKIHELYSTNKYGWMRWYFDQLHIPENARILEVGCGDCSLWSKNIDRIPPHWDITLTDFSQGMLKDARKSLGKCNERFNYRVVDVQDIPYEDDSFDVVIANHMLYHVPDIDKAFSEIYRILRQDGYFYASTIGQNHMAEMENIVKMFVPHAVNDRSWHHTEKFQLENGIMQVSKWFERVVLKRYDDSLIVTDAAPIMDYIISKSDNIKSFFTDEVLEMFMRYLEEEIKINRGIHITKDTGMFIGRKPI